MKPGSLIKFSKEHASSPGHDYVEDWIGVILECVTESAKIAWTINGEMHIMDYDESWWNKLDYEPFEVISETR